LTFRLGEVAHADRTAPDLVLIGRADAALGGADLGAAVRAFAEGIEFAVQREDQAGVIRQLELLRRDGDALAPELLDLLDEVEGVHDNAVADHGELAATHDAGGQEAEFIDHAINDERMPGIVPALIAHHDIGLLREPVDDLALAFVAPLGADYDHVGHQPIILLEGRATGSPGRTARY
jgi:hypothetical protein